MFLILSPYVYGSNSQEIKDWNHFILEGLTGLDRENTDSAGNMVCNYIGDPIIIKMKQNCGTYCYAGIKCSVLHAREHDKTFEAGAFCKTEGETCPNPAECFSQSREDNPVIENVTRVKHTSGITSYTSEEIEAKELKGSDNMSAPHSTADEQIKLARERDAEHKEAQERVNRLKNKKQDSSRNGNTGSTVGKKSGGSIFGGVFNFFRCLFKSPNCNKPQKSSGGSSSRSKATIIDDTRGR